jgi:hypothetical protein
MNLSRHVEEIRRAGGDAGSESAIHLALLDVLGEAAAEITSDLAPGSVEVRLRGREPEFVVTPPPADAVAPEPAASEPPAVDDSEMTRINMRLPEQLKSRIEQAADRDNISINAWLVRAATAALDRGEARPTDTGRRVARGGNQYRGWAR